MMVMKMRSPSQVGGACFLDKVCIRRVIPAEPVEVTVCEVYYKYE